jgi:hypothetical protein
LNILDILIGGIITSNQMENENELKVLEIPDKKFTIVEFPAKFKNKNENESVQKALKMINSGKSVEKVASGDEKYLELRFRPEDKQCHPTFGNAYKTSNLVLKVTKSNGKKKYEILGVVSNTIRKISFELTKGFEGICDYQFLGNKNEQEEINLPPPLFTRYDRPYPYKFKENPDSSIVEHKNETDGTVTLRKAVKRVGRAYNYTLGK